jgi:hypothetical protein
MSMPTFNWDDLTKAADDAGFEAVPAAEYDVIVAQADVAKTSGNNGAPKDQIKVKFKIESGPHAGKVLFNNFVLTTDNPNALAFFFRHMAALGLTRDYFQGGPTLPTVAQALVGRRCRVKVSIRFWDEQERNQVDKVLPPLGGAGAPPNVSNGPMPMASPTRNGPMPMAAPGPVPGFAPTPTAGYPMPTVTPNPPVVPPPAPPMPRPAAPAIDAAVQAQAAADNAALSAPAPNTVPDPPAMPF